MRDSKLNWGSPDPILIVMCLLALASVGCTTRIESPAPPSPGPDYSQCQELTGQAASMVETGELQNGLNSYRDALTCFEEIPDVDQLKVATARDDIAKTLSLIATEQDDPSPSYAQALDHFQLALDIRVEEWGEDDLKVAPSYDRLATVYLHLKEYAKAIEQYRKALDLRIAVLPPEHLSITSSLDSLATAYLQFGDSYLAKQDYRSAVPLLLQALGFKERSSSPQSLEVVPIMDKLAGAYSQMEDHDPAILYGEKALSVRKDMLPEDDDNLVISRNNLALLYGKKASFHFGRGENTLAQQHYEKALETLHASSAPDPTLLSSSLVNLSVLQKHLGNYAWALDLLQNALDTLVKAVGENHTDTIVPIDTIVPRKHLADIYFTLGDYPQAQAHLQQIQDIIRDLPDIPLMEKAASLSDLGAVYLRKKEKDELKEAERLFQEALDLAIEAKPENRLAVVPFMNNLAVAYRITGKTEGALNLYQEALKIRRQQLLPDDPILATSINNLAALYFSLEGYREAELLFLEALKIRQNALGPDHPDTAISLNNLGVLNSSKGDYRQALQYFTESMSSQDRTFNSLFAIASEEQKLSFVQANESTYQLTLSLIYRHFKNDPVRARQAMALVLGRKGIVLDSQSKAQSVILDNMDDPQLSGAWNRLQRLRSDLAHLLLNGPEGGDFNEYPGKIEGLKEGIRKEEAVLSHVLIGVAAESSEDKLTPEVVTASLPKNSTLVEFVRLQEWAEEDRTWSEAGRYLAFVLTRDSQVTLVDLGDARDIDAQIAADRSVIEDADLLVEHLDTYTADTDAALSDLYQRLVSPLSLHLERIDRIILAPDGELNKVPFAALRRPDGRYLVETHTISYVTSGRDLLPRESGKDPDVDLLLAAALDYGAATPGDNPGGRTGDGSLGPARPNWDFRKLPGIANSATLIPPLVPGSDVGLTGDLATESAISDYRPRVLHFATHGFFLPDRSLLVADPTSIVSFLKGDQFLGLGGVTEFNPNSPYTDLLGSGLGAMVRSGLALSGANQRGSNDTGDDGILTALEVTGMDLRATELVVLAACQTADGKVKNGEGVFGLRRAFALAGAQNVLMSQWPVSDKLTVKQMVWFYESAFPQGQPTGDPTALTPGNANADLADSLRQSQLKSIDLLRGMFDDPSTGKPVAPVLLWAPFIIQVSGGIEPPPGP